MTCHNKLLLKFRSDLKDRLKYNNVHLGLSDEASRQVRSLSLGRCFRDIALEVSGSYACEG